MVEVERFHPNRKDVRTRGHSLKIKGVGLGQS